MLGIAPINVSSVTGVVVTVLALNDIDVVWHGVSSAEHGELSARVKKAPAAASAVVAVSPARLVC